MWRIFIVAIVLGCAILANAEMPEYIKPCSKSAADFKQCCVARGNEALPHLLKGDKRLKLPSLLPLRIPNAKFDVGQNLKIKYSNIVVFGLNTVTMTDMDVDFGQQNVYIETHAVWVTLLGEYEIDGQIMVLPVTGQGPANVTIEDSKFKYSFTYKLENRDGKEYAVPDGKSKLEYKIGKAYFKLDNLFDGNRAMGDNVNKFLNDNDQDVLKELGGIVTETVSAIGDRVSGAVLGSIPFNELFLD